MNLITATLVQGAIEQGHSDKEAHHHELKTHCKRMLPQIWEAFNQIDGNHNGTLTRDEVEHCRSTLPPEIAERLEDKNLAEYFDLLDVDLSGSIEAEEFVDGILHLLLSEVPIET